jgi:NAD(P)-dependent dehydrogenase (short-subunit alcohol dehydrogenase family)
MRNESKLISSTAFTKKTVVVTGAGYGIGKQIALAFGRAGANVVLAARSEDKIAEVAGELRAMNTDPLPLRVDISEQVAVKNMVEQALEKYGSIDVLVNNAAVSGPTAMVPDIDESEWREAVDINLTGTFYCCKYVSNAMRKINSGNIITLSSVGGRTAYPMRASYSVTRWAVIGLSHTMAAELGPHGIRVNAVVPGPIEGERAERVFAARAAADDVPVDAVKDMFTKDIPIGRMPTEEEVANSVLYLASDFSSGIHGQTIQVDGGFRMQ